MPYLDKKQIIRGLESGRKLHELMREPGMPSKQLLEEWRDNDPEFEQQYQAAIETGRVKRGEPAAAPPKPKPAPIATDQDGNEHEIPRSTALRPLPTPRVGQAVVVVPSDGSTTFAVEPTAPAPPPPAVPSLKEKRAATLAANRAKRWASQSSGVAPASVTEPAPKASSPPILGDVYNSVAAWQEKSDGLEAKLAKQAKLHEDTCEAYEERILVLERELHDVRGLNLKREKFKIYVHERLDAAGIAPHEEQNAINGCRIGKRLDDLILYKQVANAMGEQEPRAEPEPQTKGPRHPGQLLALLLDLAGVSRAQFAAVLGVKPSTLKEICCGRQHLTLPLCAALERAHWGRAEVWARRQIEFQHSISATA